MSKEQLEALRNVAGPVSRETFLDLKQFESQFQKWNRRINLAAPSTIPVLWDRHILDSAQLAALKPDALRWLDIGSGGGFPGAVMAILLKDRTGAHIDLVESNRKKSAFLSTVLAEQRAPATVHAARVESIYEKLMACDIVTARAVAPLATLLKMVAPWSQNGAICLFHKGREYRNEVEESRDGWSFDLVEHRSKVDADSVVLEIAHIRQK